ncbi:hypothetical protein [Variovorax sp. OV700]|uniref:hypothetical protein n=1 Tax=Variovorax sp. OV700 TaxID=1882826 RepID=UPI001C312BB0|nr:hypothetical protein [Variovorax sp. OV700]
MKPDPPIHSSVDMAADYFHVSDMIHAPGGIHAAGRYGGTVFSASAEEIAEDPHGEHLRERVRAEKFVNKPSRFKSSFVLESLKEALSFREAAGRRGAIYRVRFVNPDAAAHKVCYSAKTPYESSPIHPEIVATQFWANPPIYSNEIFAESELEIIELCAPPL